MNLLYITADNLNAKTGGGYVTYNEYEALAKLGSVLCLDYNALILGISTQAKLDKDPWHWQQLANSYLTNIDYQGKLAHFYAGTFSTTIDKLKKQNTKITYTAAAHDREESIREYESLFMIKFPFEHLTNPALFQEYVRGYNESDVLIVPSKHSEKAMRDNGAKNRIEVIPHGCHLSEIKPLPNTFRVGYCGSWGSDKGLKYLLQAWDNLHYLDAELVIAGKDSASSFAKDMVKHFCPRGKVKLLGWVDNISDFYNQISVFCCPAISEGFGMAVLEAMAHGRPVICSTGAGAVDLVPETWTFKPRDVGKLTHLIDYTVDVLAHINNDTNWLKTWQDWAIPYTWDKIQAKYISVWKELLT